MPEKKNILVEMKKSSLIAFLLSCFLLPGIGHLYTKRNVTGIIYLIIFAIEAAIFIPLGILTLGLSLVFSIPIVIFVQFVSAIHAAVSASNYNKELDEDWEKPKTIYLPPGKEIKPEPVVKEADPKYSVEDMPEEKAPKKEQVGTINIDEASVSLLFAKVLQKIWLPVWNFFTLNIGPFIVNFFASGFALFGYVRTALKGLCKKIRRVDNLWLIIMKWGIRLVCLIMFTAEIRLYLGGLVNIGNFMICSLLCLLFGLLNELGAILFDVKRALENNKEKNHE